MGHNLGEEKISRLLWKFSIPTIIGSLVYALYNIVDRIFISRGAGSLALSGLSICFPIFNIFAAIAMFISVGAQAKISLKLGEGKKEEANKIVSSVISIYAVISLLLYFLGKLYLEDLLLLFGASTQTLPYAYDYMIVLLPLLFFMLFPFGINSLIQASGKPKIAMTGSLIGAIINIILDPIFIFYLDMGVKGAAYATGIANVVAASYILYNITFAKNRVLELKIKYMLPDFKLMKEVMNIGISPFLRKLATSMTLVVLNRSLLLYGTDLSIGAVGVIDTVSSVVFMLVMGINEGAQPIIGYNYGAKNYERVKETLIKAMITSTLIGTVSLIIIYTFPRSIISIFTEDENLLNESIYGLKLFLLMTPLLGFQTLGVNYFQAVDKAKKAIFLNVFRKVILVIPMIIIFGKLWGKGGVWIANPVADFFAALVTFVFLVKEVKELSVLDRKKRVEDKIKE